ncbi:MAG TPA: hypothetical protein VFV87_11105, partial [Pirellulaceae bacterium]|nr:hypothetical protein [Pirellulaceae bacterium]
TSAADFATRTTNLTTGLAGGIALLLGQTIHDDGAADCLNGGTDPDWLFLLAEDCQLYITLDYLVAGP